MNRYIILIVFCQCGLFFGCGEDAARDGALNGKCRLSEVQCEDGLVCREGSCQEPLGETLPELDIAVELLKRDLVANGEDIMDVQLLVNDVESNQPFNGQLLIVTEPAGVGQLSPGLIEINDGFGFGTYTSCNRRTDFPCPEVMLLQLSHPEKPFEFIFQSDFFRQVSPDITTPTAIENGSCRSEIGSQIGITLPGRNGEWIQMDTNNPLSSDDNSQFAIESENVKVEFPRPDQAINQYQALQPNEVSVMITDTEMSEDSSEGDITPMSSCLSEGVWVGSQRLEFWVEETEDGQSVSHVMTDVELDCFDERGGYTVVRACAHGTL